MHDPTPKRIHARKPGAGLAAAVARHSCLHGATSRDLLPPRSRSACAARTRDTSLNLRAVESKRALPPRDRESYVCGGHRHAASAASTRRTHSASACAQSALLYQHRARTTVEACTRTPGRGPLGVVARACMPMRRRRARSLSSLLPLPPTRRIPPATAVTPPALVLAPKLLGLTTAFAEVRGERGSVAAEKRGRRERKEKHGGERERWVRADVGFTAECKTRGRAWWSVCARRAFRLRLLDSRAAALRIRAANSMGDR
jgi:hypothetical protein